MRRSGALICLCRAAASWNGQLEAPLRRRHVNVALTSFCDACFQGLSAGFGFVYTRGYPMYSPQAEKLALRNSESQIPNDYRLGVLGGVNIVFHREQKHSDYPIFRYCEP